MYPVRYLLTRKGEIGRGAPKQSCKCGLNRAYMKIRTPNSCYSNTTIFEYFYWYLGFVVWQISGHFGRVYHSNNCASDGAFLFSLVYVMYLNIESYLHWKQIKSKLGKSCILYEWFSFLYTWIGLMSMSAVPRPLTDRLYTKSLPCFCNWLINKISEVAKGQLGLA